MRSKASDAKLTGLFLDMLAAEQGAGENTIEAYRRDLTDFSEFCARAGQSFAGVATEKLRDYLGDLDVRGFKSSSVARRLSAIRHLFRFLLNERIRTDDPAAILSGPKRGRGLPKVLSIGDVDRMLTRAKELTQSAEASAASLNAFARVSRRSTSDIDSTLGRPRPRLGPDRIAAGSSLRIRSLSRKRNRFRIADSRRATLDDLKPRVSRSAR